MKTMPDSTLFDPNQFAINWATLFEMLALVILLAFVVERALAMVYESKPYVRFSLKRKKEDKGDFKTFGAFILSALVTILFQIDLVAVILSHAHTSLVGELLTASVIAGGSKASIALFRNILDVKSGDIDRAEKELAAHRAANPPSPPPPASPPPASPPP